jgi:membrane-associated phospholipid phosphatase
MFKWNLSKSNFLQTIQSFLKFFRSFLISNWGSLLLLLMGVYLPLQVFEIMAVKVRQSESAFPWDVPILLAIHQTAQPQLYTLAVILAKIGSPKTLIPLLLVIALGLILKKRWRLSIYLLTTAIGSALVNSALKGFMHRVRPHLWESTYHKLSFSFPSGHAMASMTFVAILIVLSWETRWRLPVLIFGSLFVPIIAWTRLYLGVHFPSDILAGWLLSLAWTVGVYMIIRPHSSTVNLVNEENNITN